MAREFAKSFYNSKEWQATRELFIKSIAITMDQFYIAIDNITS